MTRRNALIIAVCVIAVGAGSGCAKRPSPDDVVLAKVSNKLITLNEFKSKVSRLPAYYQTIVENDKKRFLEDLIVEMLFYEDAVRKGVANDSEVKELLIEAKKKIIIAKYIKSEVDDKLIIPESEARKFYDEHKTEFRTPEMWRASHILVATDAEARDILAQLASGARFEELAKTRSLDATASRGGDIGFFRMGQLVPDFEKACLKLAVGGTSDVVATKFGYHIIRLTDRKEAGVETFERVRGAIENQLKRMKRTEAFDRLVLDLKTKYGVEVKEEFFKALEDRGRNSGQTGK